MKDWGPTKSEEADKFVNSFVNDFYEKFKVIPMVSYDLKEEKRKLPLELLEKIVNKSLYTMVDPQYAPEGIRTKRRKRELVIHRQGCMYLGYEWEYTLHQIGDALGFDHSTVLHSHKLIKNLLLTRDSLVTQIINSIFNAVREELRTDGNVQLDSEAGVNS